MTLLGGVARLGTHLGLGWDSDAGKGRCYKQGWRRHLGQWVQNTVGDWSIGMFQERHRAHSPWEESPHPHVCCGHGECCSYHTLTFPLIRPQFWWLFAEILLKPLQLCLRQEVRAKSPLFSLIH